MKAITCILGQKREVDFLVNVLIQSSLHFILCVPGCNCLRHEDETERMLYAVRCLKSNEDMILALAGQFKQLSHEFFRFMRQLLKLSSKCEDHIFI